jgi:hypothetical protein
MSRKRAVGILLLTSLFLSTSVALAKKKKDHPTNDYQPEAAPTGDQPSKVLERAFKLYDGEDFYSSSIELNKVVEGEIRATPSRTSRRPSSGWARPSTT